MAILWCQIQNSCSCVSNRSFLKKSLKGVCYSLVRAQWGSPYKSELQQSNLLVMKAWTNFSAESMLRYFLTRLILCRCCSCLAYVYRVMDARRKFGQRARKMRKSCSRSSREQLQLLACYSNFPSASITRYTHS